MEIIYLCPRCIQIGYFLATHDLYHYEPETCGKGYLERKVDSYAKAKAAYFLATIGFSI